MKRGVFTALIILLVGFWNNLHADPVKDVTKIGDVWVITIDKSKSMLGHGFQGNTAQISATVKRRLRNSNVFDSVDFEHDRFIFLESGLAFDTEIEYSKAIKQIGPLGQSFIHPTDNKLHSFQDKKKLTKHIGALISSGGFKYNLSFVSQIRTFSITHAVNFLKNIDAADKFDNLLILTITDDSEQNDAWRSEYRDLKRGDPKKIKEVSDTTTKYLFNNLNGRGAGILEELYSDERALPHIWLYEYKTKDQIEPDTDKQIFSIHATDGKTLSLRKRHNTYNGNKICYYHIDSVAINGHKHLIDQTFQESITQDMVYDNKLKLNQIAIWGWAQLEYDDPIYGHHYKIVRIAQRDFIMSPIIAKIWYTLLALLILAIVGGLIYLLVVRPKQKMLTIYSGLGVKTIVRRGFKGNWKGEIIPIQCYYSNCYSEIDLDFICKKHKNISCEKYAVSGGLQKEVLICSRRPLYFSNNVVSNSTDQDIKSFYFIREKIYPKLLQYIYESTFICKVYDNYHSRHSRFVNRLLNAIIWATNFFDKKYYYEIEDVTQIDKIFIVNNSFFNEKRFQIEHAMISYEDSKTINDTLIALTLKNYYSPQSTEINDIIISTIKYGDSLYWNILKLQDSRPGDYSLRHVRLLGHFIQKNASEQIDSSFVAICKYLHHIYRRASIGLYTLLTDVDLTGASNMFDICLYDVSKPSAPSIISFVEDLSAPRHQILYTPIKEYEIREKFITFNRRFKDGHIYISLIPMQFINPEHPLACKLSNNIVSTANATRLFLHQDGVEFGDINKKY